MLDILGHAAYLLLIVGSYLVSTNKPCGWSIRSCGDAAWLGLGVSMGMSSIVIWSGVFLVHDISAWSKWRRAKLEKIEFWKKVATQAPIVGEEWIGQDE